MDNDVGYLVLSRYPGESINVTVPPSSEPQRIVFTVTEVDRNKVSVATTARKEVHILRAEKETCV